MHSPTSSYGFFGRNFTVRRSYAHAHILRAWTNIGPGPGFQFTPSNDIYSFCSQTQTARPSKVLTTERLVSFSDDYEIESGQGYDTASVQRGRQIECPAVESPHDREARLFQRRLRDGERERARQRRAIYTLRFLCYVLSSGSFTAT